MTAAARNNPPTTIKRANTHRASGEKTGAVGAAEICGVVAGRAARALEGSPHKAARKSAMIAIRIGIRLLIFAKAILA